MEFQRGWKVPQDRGLVPQLVSSVLRGSNLVNSVDLFNSFKNGSMTRAVKAQRDDLLFVHAPVGLLPSCGIPRGSCGMVFFVK